ncbi:MAG: hypothetical protein WBX25_13885 [Rhodomicrobium sp.]
MVERIRSLLGRFSENEETVRRLVAADPGFDALCEEYRSVAELIEGEEEGDEAHLKRLRARLAFLEEKLLTRIEGHRPQ